MPIWYNKQRSSEPIFRYLILFSWFCVCKLYVMGVNWTKSQVNKFCITWGCNQCNNDPQIRIYTYIQRPFSLFLTHWGRNNMATISQTTFLNAFFLMKMLESRSKSHWSRPRCPINSIPALVQIMAWCRLGDKPLSEPMMVRLPTHICVTRPQRVSFVYTCVFAYIFYILISRYNGTLFFVCLSFTSQIVLYYCPVCYHHT